MDDVVGPEVSALAINVTIPEDLLPDGHLAVKAYGRPKAGGRGTYTSFRVPDAPEIAALIDSAATRAARLWEDHRGLP